MQTKDAIRFALTASDNAVMSVVDKMNDAATTFPTRKGGCHPLWVLGHLTLVEGMVPTVLFGEPNPVAEWQKYFGEHTEPVANASAYPAFDEVRAARWGSRSPADDCGLIVCDDEPRFRRKRGFSRTGKSGQWPSQFIARHDDPAKTGPSQCLPLWLTCARLKVSVCAVKSAR